MRLSNGNTEVVAPSSAPMLVTVALAVQESDSVPGPKYSMILLVPPATVSMPASLRITSFAGPAGQFPGQPHADQFRPQQLPRHADHHVHGVGAAHADRQHAETAGVRR